MSESALSNKKYKAVELYKASEKIQSKFIFFFLFKEKNYEMWNAIYNEEQRTEGKGISESVSTSSYQNLCKLVHVIKSATKCLIMGGEHFLTRGPNLYLFHPGRPNLIG